MAKKISPRNQLLTGFTLFELLTTITIIALLMSLIFSCISAVRFQGWRVECMSNLRQLYHLVAAHANDHRGRVLATGRIWYGQLYPDSIGISGPVADSGVGLSWPELQPYSDVPLADSLATSGEETRRTIGIWMCPSRRSKDSRAIGGNLVNQGDGNTYLNTSYSFLAGSEKWSNVERASSGEDLTQSRLDPQRILISDLFILWAGRQFFVNHTRTDSVAESQIPTSFAGMNRLFGDGRVAWKTASEFDLSAISAGDSAQPHVRSELTDRWYY